MAENFNTTIPLSSLFSDPALRAFFERGELDGGFAYAIPEPDDPVLLGGDACELELA